MGSVLATQRGLRESFVSVGNGQDGQAAEGPVLPTYYLSNRDGNNFTELVKNTEYKDVFETSFDYSIYINRQRSHWYILVQADNTTFPYVTFELVTEDGTTTTALVCQQRNDTGKQILTTTNTSLLDLCSVADRYQNEMKRYNVIHCNGQQFCNAFLGCFNLPALKTTIGKDLPNAAWTITESDRQSTRDEDNFDRLNFVCDLDLIRNR